MSTDQSGWLKLEHPGHAHPAAFEAWWNKEFNAVLLLFSYLHFMTEAPSNCAVYHMGQEVEVWQLRCGKVIHDIDGCPSLPQLTAHLRELEESRQR